MAVHGAELPPYRALLVVDIKDFSGVPGVHHAEITDLVPVVLNTVFERCGLDKYWNSRLFGFSTGDGYVVGLHTGVLPRLLNPFLRVLQSELAYRAEVAADPVPLRMRVTVHVGPVTDSGQELASDGSGVARVEAHRLLDATPVRDLLTRSGPSTHVAAIVSGRAYHDAVASGYANEPADLYVQVPVKVKTYSDLAYLRVPVPTGDLLGRGFLPPAEPEAATAVEPVAGTTTNTAQHVHGKVVQAGRDVAQTHNNNYTFHQAENVNTGSGDQINGVRDHRGPR
ncbi:hypothetical protein [Actinokineospora globicatena]|uniref:hypothetical protein n=1 Tax=Actinokineospora globicatena TaxID=103729 RepID=UPI0020A31CD4|nr:hypothetical protein [Actinokineospora globicatena]MCP2301753.1 hypothetical protein [Actinokineospora globicatena]GLW76589.1 hypothetical protein Aglo01_10710 [Actinokineospora globicatena]GLW83423.1 hypothetical protein Aglo02_10630 [Actinokineospora globicatena]